MIRERDGGRKQGDKEVGRGREAGREREGGGEGVRVGWLSIFRPSEGRLITVKHHVRVLPASEA